MSFLILGCELPMMCIQAQSCLSLVTPWTVAHQVPLAHGIFQARILECLAISYSKGFF